VCNDSAASSSQRCTRLAALEVTYNRKAYDTENGIQSRSSNHGPCDSASIRAMARAHAGAEETQGQGKESGAPIHDKNTRRGI